jgi:23S rRNA pseudouridine2605 synthase
MGKSFLVLCRPMTGQRRRRGDVALERALSKLGLASRARAREAIRAGRVTVDGDTVIEPLRPVAPERSDIRLDGAAARPAERIVIACHKPRGVVVTRCDPDGRPTIFERLADLPPGLVAVGRLDLATSGLLLLTNDTRLADWLTDPRHALSRVYLVTVRGRVGEEDVARMTAGVADQGETLRAAAVEIRKASGRESHLVLELREGKNREVRRLCAAVGHEVTRLRRVAFAGIELGELAPGEWRMLAEAEIRAWSAPARGARTPSPAPTR